MPTAPSSPPCIAAMSRMRPGKRFDVEASVALDDCGKGKPATAIPVLEKKLRESGFSLPEGIQALVSYCFS